MVVLVAVTLLQNVSELQASYHFISSSKDKGQILGIQPNGWIQGLGIQPELLWLLILFVKRHSVPE